MQPATKGLLITLLALVNVIALRYGFTDDDMGYGVLIVSLPLLVIAIFIFKNPSNK